MSGNSECMFIVIIILMFSRVISHLYYVYTVMLCCCCNICKQYRPNGYDNIHVAQIPLGVGIKQNKFIFRTSMKTEYEKILNTMQVE